MMESMNEIQFEFDYDGSDESFSKLISWINTHIHVKHFDVLIYTDKSNLKPGKAIIRLNKFDLRDVIK